MKPDYTTKPITAFETTFSWILSVLFKSILACLLLFHPLTANAVGTSPEPSELSQAEIMRLGERMYRDGILPSGVPMPAFIRGDVEVDSSAFSCSSCHMRAGLGSFEGGVLTPPTTGIKLYKPYRRPPSQVDIQDQAKRSVYANTVQERPAYTRESLAAALRFGTDPAGQIFNDVMPRYPLSDGDMSIMVRYLEALSSEPSPGASSREFKFATIITDDVSPADRQALLVPLQRFVAQKNQQMKMFADFKKFGYTPTNDMKSAFRQASLDVWELKGPSDTWRRQLDAYISKNPVFAVMGGISNSDWRPIHDFCEAQRLPCLFPITDFPVVSDTDWYTLYFNKGYYQEGEGTALYLNRQEGLPEGARILQLVQDSPAGKALANGFDQTWKNLGHPPVTSLVLSKARLLDRESLSKLLTEHKAAALLLWADAELLPDLPILAGRLADPGMVFVSSVYLGKKTTAIPETIRDKVYITFPYRLTPYVGPKTGGYDSKVPILASAKDFGDRRIESRITTMLQQSTLQGLNLIYDNLYRDHLLDIMSMQMDLTVRDYERFSFGPGQRYASKGCYIIQLGPGPEPALLPRSEWVLH